MYLYRYRKRPNFGDVLNDVIWPEFIKCSLDETDSCDDVFVGIGTLLNERLPNASRLHILGTGLGYGQVSREMMQRWDVHFVRGPLTAKALSLDPALAIADPAILLNRMEDLNRHKDIECSFMPHHSIDSDRYRKICEDVGINYISPESPCLEIIDEILRSKRIIASAMHGAIVAEAFRVPWFPVITNDEILVAKWHDWSKAMNIEIEFQKLPTIYPYRRASIRGHLTGFAKEFFCKRQLEMIKRSKDFILGSDLVLQDRLRRIEEKIEIFNEKLV